MPANLTPDYMNAEKAFKAAKTDEERLECLREMLATIPKHKGTDKMQADIKKRIAKLRDKMEQHGKSRKTVSYHVKREGAGQIVFAGPPNAGKSSLIKRLTNAEPDVAAYPFSTRDPYPAMMPYLDVKVQLVDLPPVSVEHTEHWVYDLIKAADCAAVVVNVAGNHPVDEYTEMMDLLGGKKIFLNGPPEGEEPERGSVHRKSILVATHGEEDPGGDLTAIFMELTGCPLELVEVSANNQDSLERLRKRLYEILDVIRVYSKPPGVHLEKKDPYTVPRGTDLIGFAEHVHKDFASGLKFARCWGSAKYDGQSIPHDHVLQDGDIVELHV